jgi:hypothetical protein
MPCYSPLTAYRAKTTGESGKRALVFNPNAGYRDRPVQIPCGQCVGCRLEKSRQWAIRCVHEATEHERNCFITLTYSPENLPKDHSLDKTHFQKFMKRLRKLENRPEGDGIRFYACGEYGELRNRPHYHAILFNHDFEDKTLWSKKNGNLLFRSETLERLWPYGFASIGNVTFESAAYVARYCMKKITGEKAEDEYKILDKETGEIYEIQPEFALMSRRPGIGKTWYEKYRKDTDKDFITVNKQKCGIPRYYDTLREKLDEKSLEEIKWKRREKAAKNKEENKPERLRQKETVKKEQTKLLIRSIEEN